MQHQISNVYALLPWQFVGVSDRNKLYVRDQGKFDLLEPLILKCYAFMQCDKASFGTATIIYGTNV